MHYFIYSTADSWITSGSLYAGISSSNSQQNFGQDEILEIKKEFIDSSLLYFSRAIVNFKGTDLTAISQSIVDGKITDPIYKLRLYETEGVSDMSTEYTLTAQPISESWDEGIGKFGDNPVTKEGVSWKYRNQFVQNGTSTAWDTEGCTIYLDQSSAQTASATVTISDYTSLTGDTIHLINTAGSGVILTEGVNWDAETNNDTSATNLSNIIGAQTGLSASAASAVVTLFQEISGSAGNTTITPSAGGWIVAPAFTNGRDATAQSSSIQTFSYESPDVNMDVSNMVEGWFSGSLSKNNGMLLKYSGSQETDNTTTGQLKFFSRNTNTIYPPKLEVLWDDHIPATGDNTGSLSEIDVTGTVDNFVYVKGLRDRYKETEKVKFRIGARPNVIPKTVSTTYNDVTSSFIPEGSGSYSIIDSSTGEVLVPFDTYSKLSCDVSGSYFNQWLNTFQPNRVYKILIKVLYNDNQEIIYDDNFEFKVVR
tara:strand:- start:1251 stop:2693 length:1443 start_codon:yes stop_codon:yes gene_type:complete